MTLEEQLTDLSILQGRMLVGTYRFVEIGEGEFFAEKLLEWFELDGSSIGPPRSLGTIDRPRRTEWVELGGRLLGQVWSVPEGGDPRTRTERDRVHLWSASLDAIDQEQVAIPARPVDVDSGGAPTVVIGIAFLATQLEELPAAIAEERWNGVLVAQPRECDRSIANYFRVFELLEDGSRAVSWESPICSTDAVAANRLSVSNPELVATDSGLGVLYRIAGRESPENARVHYSLIRPGEPGLTEPREVGGHTERGTGDMMQPRAVSFGNRVMVAVHTGATNACFRLRRMSDRGTNVQPLAWQLPCRSNNRVTHEVELERYGDDAGILWSEQPFLRNGFIEGEYEEGLYFAVLDRDGRRASNVVSLGSPAPSSRRGALPGRLLPVLATEDDLIVAAWNDTRAEAPGAYIQRIRCQPVD